MYPSAAADGIRLNSILVAHLKPGSGGRQVGGLAQSKRTHSKLWATLSRETAKRTVGDPEVRLSLSKPDSDQRHPSTSSG